MADRRRVNLTQTAIFFGCVGVTCFVIRHRLVIMDRIRNAYNYKNPLRHKRIRIIETLDECHSVVQTLKKDCASYKVLGFDCEWVTVSGSRRPVALLQLSSHKGLCALIRLCVMQQIPKSLRDLLEDDDIIKVGVGPHEDAQKLAHDYGVGVASTLDLRFMAVVTGEKPGGLAKMSEALLGVTLDKNWRLSCSNWEARVLTDKQLNYAANDSLVGIEIFKFLAAKMGPRYICNANQGNSSSLHRYLEPFFDVTFKQGDIRNLDAFSSYTEGISNRPSSVQTKNTQTRHYGTRARRFYDNCLLEAPNGELLCTVERRKAQWYIDRKLGAVVNAEPFTVRLNFEPAGRPVGEVGRYYQTPKENKCVVCGRQDAFLRKHVVPREYRKHFPDVMKTHASHDILLLCPECHQISNISDLKVRSKLAALCDAPLAGEERGSKLIEVPALRSLRSAARALLYNAERIPPGRREGLKKIIMEHYAESTQHKTLTEEILREAGNINTTLDNENYYNHGQKVVTSYMREHGGLVELERLWREHFIKSMHPRFLPHLWNVNHNANRLEIRAQEGRVDKADLLAAGLKTLSIDEDYRTATPPIPPQTEEIKIT